MTFRFSLLLECSWANAGPLLWDTPRQTNVKHCVWTIFLSESHRQSGNKTEYLGQLFLLLSFGDLLSRDQNDLKAIL